MRQVLFIDVRSMRTQTTTWDEIISEGTWTHVFLLLRAHEDEYRAPSLCITPTMIAEKRVPQFELVYVPSKADAYAFGAGFINGRFQADDHVSFFTTNISSRQLQPLIGLTGMRVHLMHSKPEDEDSSSADDESSSEDTKSDAEDEEDTPSEEASGDMMLRSLMETMQTDQGQQLLSSLMTGMMQNQDGASG